MTDFAKQVYADMSSTDRVLLYMIKAKELIDFADIMTEEDVRCLKKVCKDMERKSPCDLCRYNPPSSTDGKPCTMCPATPKEEI